MRDLTPDEQAALRTLIADETSWRGGYELTDEAGEALFDVLGLEPRCCGSISDDAGEDEA